MKRSQILEAEGKKRARVLEAEGVRSAKILEAEGERLATILEAQGDAQKLRILSLGSATLDPKSLTVLSYEAVKNMADGQATKIIFPFEVSRLLEGISDYVGASRQVKETTPTNYADLENIVGKADTVLGDIPSPDEIKQELDKNASDVDPNVELHEPKLDKELNNLMDTE